MIRDLALLARAIPEQAPWQYGVPGLLVTPIGARQLAARLESRKLVMLCI